MTAPMPIRHPVTAGKWDARHGADVPPFRLRWFFSWSELNEGRIAGFFAGYEGGNAFVEERFWARFNRDALVEFVWNGRDHVTTEDRSAEAASDELEALCDEHFEKFIRWHDREEWDRGFLCLAPGRDNELTWQQGSLLLRPVIPGAVMVKVAAMARRTGILCSF